VIVNKLSINKYKILHMKKINLITLLSISVLFMTSCSLDFLNSDRENDEVISRACLEEKYDEIQDKVEDSNYKLIKVAYSSIEDCLQNYDFVQARMYLSCYSNTCYGAEGVRINTADVDDPINSGNQYLFYEDKINIAEIMYLVQNNEFERAKILAIQAGIKDKYLEIRSEFDPDFKYNKKTNRRR